MSAKDDICCERCERHERREGGCGKSHHLWVGMSHQFKLLSH